MNESVGKLKAETAIVNLDGFDGLHGEYESGEDDQDQFTSPRVIQGERIGFLDGVWLGADKQPLPSGLQLIVADMARIVQKWGPDNMPAAPPIILGPNEKWPDVKAKNDACPKTEWRLRFGELQGPYQKQKVLYLWDPITMNKYSWPASSNSGMAAIADLFEKVAMMREFKKQRAVPIVLLRSKLWSKRFNKQGPYLEVVGWIAKTADGTLLPGTTDALSLPGPTTAQEAVKQFPGVQTVTPPTGKEATRDEIPF